jgi:hypothetical protein
MKLVTFSKLAKNLLTAALAVSLIVIPTPHRVSNARSATEVSVDIEVAVNNSDIGVSEEVLDAAVEHVLDEAHIHHVRHHADSTSVHLKIDIYRKDNGHFKIDGDLSGPPDEVENGEDKEEKECQAQDDIDDMVIAIVHDFVKFIHHT